MVKKLLFKKVSSTVNLLSKSFFFGMAGGLVAMILLFVLGYIRNVFFVDIENPEFIPIREAGDITEWVLITVGLMFAGGFTCAASAAKTHGG